MQSDNSTFQGEGEPEEREPKGHSPENTFNG